MSTTIIINKKKNPGENKNNNQAKVIKYDQC